MYVKEVRDRQRLGREVIGEVMNKIRSSAKRPHLWVWGPQDTLLMSGFSHIAIAVSINMFLLIWRKLVVIKGSPVLCL